MKKLFVLTLILSMSFTVTTVSHSNQYWAKTYGGYHEEFPYSFEQTSDSGYVVLSSSYIHTSPYVPDVLVVKINEDGRIVWQNTYGGSDVDRGYSIRQTIDGGYIIAGHTESFGSGLDDIWLLKLGSSGTIEWQKTYGGADDDGAFSVQQTSDGGYIVSGATKSFGAGSTDIWVLKLDAFGDITWQKTYGGEGSENVKCSTDL